MLDWNALVRKQLSAKLPTTHLDDVAAELANHLEDAYEEVRAQGICESEAIDRVLSGVTDWRRLGRQIGRAQRGRNAINERAKQLWLPALANLAAANLVLMILTRASLEPRVIASHSTSWFPGLALVGSYLPWLAAQPLAGGLGAHLSRRAGGKLLTRLVAALFSAIVMLGCWAFVIPVSTLFEKNAWALNHPIYLVFGGCVWVLPAGMGLFFGSLPFLADDAPKPRAVSS